MFAWRSYLHGEKTLASILSDGRPVSRLCEEADSLRVSQAIRAAMVAAQEVGLAAVGVALGSGRIRADELVSLHDDVWDHGSGRGADAVVSESLVGVTLAAEERSQILA